MSFGKEKNDLMAAVRKRKAQDECSDFYPEISWITQWWVIFVLNI